MKMKKEILKKFVKMLNMEIIIIKLLKKMQKNLETLVQRKVLVIMKIN